MVVNLTDRIKMINKTMQYEHQSAESSTPAEKQPVVEEQEGPKVHKVTDEELAQAFLQPEPATVDDILAQLKKLTEAIQAQETEIKKINKHVNATQKELKKARKNAK